MLVAAAAEPRRCALPSSRPAERLSLVDAPFPLLDALSPLLDALRGVTRRVTRGSRRGDGDSRCELSTTRRRRERLSTRCALHSTRRDRHAARSADGRRGRRDVPSVPAVRAPRRSALMRGRSPRLRAQRVLLRPVRVSVRRRRVLRHLQSCVQPRCFRGGERLAARTHQQGRCQPLQRPPHEGSRSGCPRATTF